MIFKISRVEAETRDLSEDTNTFEKPVNEPIENKLSAKEMKKG